MANLGNLWFSVGLKDQTDADWVEIVNKIKNRTMELGLKIDKDSIEDALRSIQSSGRMPNVKVGVEIDKKKLLQAYHALDGLDLKQLREARLQIKDTVNAGLADELKRSRSALADYREERTKEVAASIRSRDALTQLRMSYIASQKELARSRSALARLREARLRDMEATRQQKTANDSLGKSMQKTGNFAQSLRNQISNIYSVYMMESFLSSLIRVGGEFQKQHIALQAMLGDAAKADTIFSQIKELAVESPFNFQNLTGYTKQLAAFSIPYEELYETTKRLADISSGLGIDMGRIILAYGQVRSAEFLRGTELRQFTEAGIPLLDQLAKKFSQLEGQVVSVGEVFDKISMREVPFEMVKEVLWDLTNEGGQFYKMQEVLTESLSGKLDKLKDSYQIMLSTIAESNNWLIGGSLDMLTNLTSHWQTMWNVLMSVIVALGAYKTVVVIANAKDAIAIIMKYKFAKATQASTIALLEQAAAQKVVNARSITMIQNLSKLKARLSSIAGAAGGLAIVAAALFAIGTYAYNAYQDANKLRNELEDIDEKAAGDIESLVYGYQRLVSQLKEAEWGTQEYADIVKQINSSYGQYLDNLFSEAEAYENIAASVNKVTEAIVKKVQNQAYEQKVSAVTGEYTDRLAEQQKEIADRISDVYGVNDKLAKIMAEDVAYFIKQGMGYEDAMRQVADIHNKAYRSLEKIKSYTGDTQSMGGTISVRLNVAQDYENIYKEFQTKLNEITQDQLNQNPYSREIDKIKRKWDEINKAAKSEEEVRLNTIKMYGEQLAKLKNMGMPEGDDMFKSIQQQLEAAKKPMEDWIKLANEVFKTSVNIDGKDYKINNLVPQKSEYTKIVDYLNRVAEAYKKAGEEIDKFNQVATPGRTDDWFNSVNRNTAIRQLSERLFSGLGMDINAWTKKTSTTNGGGSSKDVVAERWKKRLELLKQAESEYRKWSELVGKEEAVTKLKESGLFGDLGKNFDFENARKEISKFVKEISKSASTTEQKDVARSGVQVVWGFKYDDNKQELDKTLKEVERYIQDTTKKWDLYKQLFEATGDKEYSMSIAFSDAPVWDEAATAMREELEKRMEAKGIKVKLDFTETEEEAKRIFGSEDSELYKLWNETKKRIEENGIDLKVNAAKAIENTMSIQDKIRAKEAQKSEALQPYQAGTSEYEAIAKQFDNEIMNLRASLLELDPAFQKIFADTTGMSIRQIEALRKQAQSFLDLINKTATPVLDENGQVKGYQYTDASGNQAYIDKKNYDDIQKRIEKLGKKASEVSIAFSRLWDWISGDKDADLNFMDIAKDLSILTQEAANAAGSIASMFEAFGNDSLSDGFSFAGEMLGSVSSIASGLASNPFAVIGGIASGITSIAGLHDKKLDRAIERSQQRAQMLKNTYDEIERSLERFLGDGRSMKLTDAENDREELRQINAEIDNIRRKGRINIFDQKKLQGYEKDAEKLQKRVSAYDEGGAYGYQRQLLEEQYAELEKQRQAELDKKKTDPSKVADYEAQMSELRDQITYFAQDLASELYGIDLKDWASQLGDALYEAWQKGEDGAEAFKNKAGEIIGNVMNEILKMRILEPAMKDISDYLFGTDEEREANGGKGGVFGTDMELSDDDVKGLADKFIDMSNTSEQYTEAMDKVNEYLKQLGYDIKDAGESSGGLSASIGKITEDQADLLASYINGIRADVSLNKELFKQLVNDTLPGMSRIAQAQLRHLETIARNTGNNAESAAEILEILRRNVNGANKFNI